MGHDKELRIPSDSGIPAKGVYLDRLGKAHGLKRNLFETDEEYRERIWRQMLPAFRK